MAAYLVLKTMKLDWTSMPGELIIDPPTPELLMQRGYIVPVPDDFEGRAVSRPPAGPPQLEETDSPSPDEEASEADEANLESGIDYYAAAKELNVRGRSKMNEEELKAAVEAAVAER